ncbi:MAG: hypothetical protein R3D43_03565 [Tepidamorphaceae bacterium]
MLEEAGVQEDRFAEVSGKADSDPLFPRQLPRRKPAHLDLLLPGSRPCRPES